MRVRRFADWSPVAPRGTPSRISTPTRALWLHYGAVGRANFATAVSHTRYHIVTLRWLHTGYQGYVIPGQLLLARPPDRMGAHTRGHNSDSALCVPGDGRPADVTDRLIDTLAWAAVYGHRQGWWPPEFTGGHRQAPRNTSNTPCPGNALTAAIPEINRRARQLLRGQERTWLDMASEKDVERLAARVADERIARAFDLADASDGWHITNDTHRELVAFKQAAGIGHLRDLQYLVDPFRRARDLGLLDHMDTLAAIAREHNDGDAAGDY